MAANWLMLCCDACAAHGPAAKPIQTSFSGCKPTGLWRAVELSEGKAKRMCKRQQQPPLPLTAEGLRNHQVGQGECQQTEQGSQSCAGDGWANNIGEGRAERRSVGCTAARTGAAGCKLPTFQPPTQPQPPASPLEEVQIMSRKVKKGPASRVKLQA